MSIHDEFILEPITNVLERGLSSIAHLGNGMETYPMLDYVLQSIFLKMTGFQEQKLKCIIWTIATYDYQFRYDFTQNRIKFGECSNYKDKQSVFATIITQLKNLDFTADDREKIKDKIVNNTINQYIKKDFIDLLKKCNCFSFFERYINIHDRYLFLCFDLFFKNNELLNNKLLKENELLPNISKQCKSQLENKILSELLDEFNSSKISVECMNDKINNLKIKITNKKEHFDMLSNIIKSLETGKLKEVFDVACKYPQSANIENRQKNEILKMTLSNIEKEIDSKGFLNFVIKCIKKNIKNTEDNIKDGIIDENIIKTEKNYLNYTLYDAYDLLYKHRNRCAHNSLSYQKNLPDLQKLNNEAYKLDNYYIRFCILILIDNIFVELYKEYLTRIKTKQILFHV